MGYTRQLTREQLRLDVGELEDITAPPLCAECNVDTLRAREFYMVADATWLATCDTYKGFLCIGCIERRLGRRLKPDDFTDAPVNNPAGCSPRLRARLTARAEKPAA